MTRTLRILGIAALLLGALWIGQGLGLIMWPASSFMLAQMQWCLYRRRIDAGWRGCAMARKQAALN